MPYSLLFTDSEATTSTRSPENLAIRLSAARTLQIEGSGHKPEEGFSRGVKLLFSGLSQLEGDTDFLIGRISHGRIRIDGQWSSTLPLPCAITAPLQIEMDFANQSSLSFTATGVECGFEGEPNFSESLFC